MRLSWLIGLALVGVWLLIAGDFYLDTVLFGLLFAVAFVLVTGVGKGQRVAVRELPVRFLYLCLFVLLLLYDLVRSNYDLARRLLRWQPDIRPGIVRLQTEELPAAAEAMDEHAVTLTPGQVIIDYTADERRVYVHLVDATQFEALRGSIWRHYRTVLRRVFS